MIFPTVITTSVIRGADQGGSHGGVYLVDLDKDKVRQVVDWNTPDIDWSGRGGDRGLRGVAIYGERVYMAASDEIFVYDLEFKLVNSFRHPLLKHCHETFRANSTLYITSTGYNAILEFDLEEERFTTGTRIGFGRLGRVLYSLGVNVRPRATSMQLDEPERYPLVGKDSMHINSVYVADDRVYFSGTRIQHLFVLDGRRVESYAPVPRAGHNARPYRGGVLMNDTASNQVAWLDRKGKLQQTYAIPLYSEAQLEGADLPQGTARQGFARGLCVTEEDLIVVGSSPATISVFGEGRQEPLKTINITMDVRNAIHGLELWPF